MKKILLLFMLVSVSMLAQEKQMTYRSGQLMTSQGMLQGIKQCFFIIRVKPIKNQALQVTLVTQLEKGKLVYFYFREAGKRETNRPNETDKYKIYSLKSEDSDERIKVVIYNNRAILKYSDGSAMHLLK